MAKINIYSTPTCTFCQLAKQFFTDNGVEYTEFDVSVDEAKRNEMIEKTGQMGVPVIVVSKEEEEGGGEEVVVGFEEGKMKELLNL